MSKSKTTVKYFFFNSMIFWNFCNINLYIILVLQPYKYAGYNQLIKTIQLEIDDDLLFSKQTILLPSSIELIYYTIKCSSLNAEEFNRENGFEVSYLY